MAVLPLQFRDADSVQSLGVRGDETFAILGMDSIRPQQDVTVTITGPNGAARDVVLRSRIDTPAESEYYRHGGILPFVMREILARK